MRTGSGRDVGIWSIGPSVERRVGARRRHGLAVSLGGIKRDKYRGASFGLAAVRNHATGCKQACVSGKRSGLEDLGVPPRGNEGSLRGPEITARSGPAQVTER